MSYFLSLSLSLNFCLLPIAYCPLPIAFLYSQTYPMKSNKAIFISHAWGGISDEILAELTKTLEKEDISFILDKRDLGYRASINEFMVELGKADMVIIILSNKYLKSEYCMFELIQIYRNQNLRDRIFPIVLDEVKISSSADRLEFVKYWEDQLQNLQAKVKELDSLSYIEGITEDLNLYAEIRNNIARLTGILRDINTLNVTIHVESDYRDLIQSIKRKISGEPKEEENKIYITSTKPHSPYFNTFNYKLAGGSVLVFFGIFITWKILSRPKAPDNGEIFFESGTVVMDDTSTTVNAFDSAEVRKYASEMMKQVRALEEDEGSKDDIEIITTVNGTTRTTPKESAQSTYKPPPKTNKQQTKPEEKPVEKYTYRDPVNPAEQPKQQLPEEKHEVITIPTENESSKTTKSLKPFTVPKGTILQARSTVTISSDDELAVPRRINFVLDQDVYDGKNIAIPAGSSVVGTLSAVKTSDNKRAGSVTFFFTYLVAPDGQKIPLQKEEMYLVANGKVPYEIHPNNKVKLKTSTAFQIKY